MRIVAVDAAEAAALRAAARREPHPRSLLPGLDQAGRRHGAADLPHRLRPGATESGNVVEVVLHARGTPPASLPAAMCRCVKTYSALSLPCVDTLGRDERKRRGRERGREQEDGGQQQRTDQRRGSSWGIRTAAQSTHER